MLTHLLKRLQVWILGNVLHHDFVDRIEILALYHHPGAAVLSGNT